MVKKIEIDLKCKQLFQDIVDKECFEIYECFKSGRKFKEGGKGIPEVLNSKLDDDERKLIFVNKDKIYQISSALGNMIVFRVYNLVVKEPEILW